MKRISHLRQAIAGFPPGGTIVLHSCFSDPPRLTADLAECAEALSGATVRTLMPMGACPYVTPPASDHLRIRPFVPGAGLRQAVNDGRAQVQASPLSQTPGIYASGRAGCDLLLLHLSPLRDGTFSLGLSVDVMHEALARNPIVVAEVNPALPRTLGDTLIPADLVDFVIDGDRAPATAVLATPDQTDARIAANVAALITDGMVLQFGIGAIPEQVLVLVSGRRDLGVHTGLATSALRPLVEGGAVSNRWRGGEGAGVVTGMVGGDLDFYRSLDQNPDYEFKPTAHTHDHGVLSSIERLFAINSVIQMDLTGDGNAERIAGRTVSAPGGLPDFAAGATAAPGGLSIIAMRATGRGGTVSNIVRRLDADAPVSVPGAHVDYVVTEFGAAHIRDCDPDETAHRLRAVAHPDFRETLR